MRYLRNITIVILLGLAAALLMTSYSESAAAQTTTDATQAPKASGQGSTATAQNAPVAAEKPEEAQQPAATGGTPAAASQKSTASNQQANGIPLNTDLTVQGNVTAQAVLIPWRIASRVFGIKIANEYAVIQIIINNKSPDAALIVHGVYMDDRKWALSGGGISNEPCQEEDSTDPKAKFADCTKSSQVASEEYRVVRGHALDSQIWTWRNGIVRGLVLAGSIATGLTFTATGNAAKSYSEAVAAFNGDLVPGVGLFAPDQTVDQINRISDVGYRTNKVIDRQGSDVIVCFFPIDRFLTAGFKRIFVEDPALFISPLELLVDPNAREPIRWRYKHVNPADFFKNLGIEDLDGLAKALPCYLAYTHELEVAARKAKALAAAPSEQARSNMERQMNQEKEERDNLLPDWVKKLQRTLGDEDKGPPSCKTLTPGLLLEFQTLSAVSLNRVYIVVDGVMSVETSAIPAKIESIVFDNEKTDSNLWIVGSGASAAGSSTAPSGSAESSSAGAGTTDSANAGSTTKNSSSNGGSQAKGQGTASPAAPSASSAKTLTGTITGSFLTGGSPIIQNKEDLGISDVSVVTDGSNDQTLKFSLKLSTSIGNQKELIFVVEKKQTDTKGAPVDSTPYTYRVQYVASSGPKITGVSFPPNADWTKAGEEVEGTIEGIGLAGGTPDINDKSKYGLDIHGDTTNSTDANLNVTVTLGKQVDPGTVLTFTVTTTQKDSKGNSVSATCEHCTYTVPKPGPTIKNVEFAAKTSWTKPGTITGTITGANLTDASPDIVEKDKYKIEDIRGIATSKPASTLGFTMSLTTKVDPGVQLTFVVTTQQKNSGGTEKTITCNCKWVVTVPGASAQGKPPAKAKPAKANSGASQKPTAPAKGTP